jgi:PAS domain S-box-containing protein
VCRACGGPLIETPPADVLEGGFYRMLVETAEEGIWVLDAAAKTTFVNLKMAAMLGYAPHEMVGRHLFAFMSDEAIAQADKSLSKRRAGVRETHDFEFLHRDGHAVLTSISTGPLTDADGNYAGAVGMITDVSNERRTQLQLAASEEKMRHALEAANLGAWYWDIRASTVSWSDGNYRLLGLEPGSVPASYDLWRAHVHPEDREGADTAALAAVDAKSDLDIEYRVVWPDGTIRRVRDLGKTVLDAAGEPVAMYGIQMDVTAEYEARRALLRREAILEAVSVSARQLLRSSDWREVIGEVLARLGSATEVSRAYLFENHRSRDGKQLLTSQRAEWVAPGVAPELLDPALQGVDYLTSGFGRWRALFEAGMAVTGRVGDFPEAERELLETQGILALTAVPIRVEDSWWGWLGLENCTEEKNLQGAELAALSAAADAIAAALERSRSTAALREGEEMLRLSQKMEAVGRLAGGVAHDFNNLLTAITGYAELIHGSLDAESPLRKDVEQVLRAAGRAAELTSKLLAFGRRQTLEPRRVDVGAVIDKVEDLLKRIIGEDIELRTTIAPDLGALFIDPGQLEQVLVNLTVNSRDAMPTGGCIDIEAHNAEIAIQAPWRVEAGSYIELSVSDTGVGIPLDIRERIFEPFFTTKGQSGTGLGLATVYGIIEQSGGDILVEDVEPHGTRFRLLLPMYREDRPAAAAQRPPETPSAPAALAGKTILLVEDQPQVRQLIAKMLAQHKCRVVTAEGVSEAERHAAGCAFDLLLTDIVLPDGNGRDLARRLRRSRPNLPVLLMSGYDEDRAGLADGAAAADFGYLPKPFSGTALLDHLMRALTREHTTSVPTDPLP